MVNGSVEKPSVVGGIGASAGGVEALRTLFQQAQPGGGIAYIVLLHLAPNRGSELTEILARECALPVTTAEDGASLEADHVYVIPPGVFATVAEGKLVLTLAERTHRDPRSIDVLFSSLADAFNERAVGVILSGFGHDGTIGIKAIKEHGGLTVAQGSNGTSPGHSSMPDSAIAGGQVDLVVPAGDIPRKLADYAASLDNFGGFATDATDGTAHEGGQQARLDAARGTICGILRQEVGHDFSGYKSRTFLRRVHRRMQVLHLASLDAYIGHLRANHDEAVALLGDLLISVTAFFRDEDTFATLAAQAIPSLFAGKGAEDMVRVWVPGCATGEESFSLAMLLCEHAGARGGDAATANLRDRHRRGRAGGGPRRSLSDVGAPACLTRAAPALLRRRGADAHRHEGTARHLRLLLAQPDPGPALLAPGPDLLP